MKENRHMSVVSEKSLCMAVAMLLAGLVSLGGCSKKSVVAITSGTEAAPAKVESAPPKSPTEERVQPPPMVVAKADEAEIAARKAREAAQKQLADIYFAFDKWALTTEGKKNLAQSAEALKRNSSAKLLIEGHCDERGSREYNLVLGEKRAQETRRYLEALGIKNPVTITSFGKERPVCTEHNESCYWKNRRAHLVVEESK